MADRNTPEAVLLAFASGTADLNRAMLDRFAAVDPQLPLYVVAEFEPHCGIWIPYHVPRRMSQNRAAIRATLGGAKIAHAALVLVDGTALAPMRLLAASLAPATLVAYDAALNPGPLLRQYLRYTAASIESQFTQGGRGRKWLDRLANPSDAEIPVRARLAQAYGKAANRFRRVAGTKPRDGESPLEPGISVVVPSRDGRELIAAMLPPLLPQLTRGEVIVVDNGSSDGTVEWLANEHPAIRTIHSPTPLSFARAVNLGIAKARHEHILLLNNDMVVEPGFLEALANAFHQVPDLFCATAQIFFPQGIRREETGKAVWRREEPLDFPVRCDDPLPGEDLTWVFYGSGGCSLFDTDKLRRIGGVSEVYDPAYVEDMDFGYRAWARGWPSVYCAGARVEHRHRATTSRFFTPRQLDFFVERNYLRFLIHAIGSPTLFDTLWMDAIRRLQLLASNGSESALDALRDIPSIGARPPRSAGQLTDDEILALGNGDLAAFPGVAPKDRRKVLIASPCIPFPLSHGGAVRIYNLMREAAKTSDLVLVAFCDELAPPPVEVLDLCVEVVMVRRHRSHYKLDTGRPDTVEEFESATFRACLKQTAHRWKPSVVQLEFTWMAQYAGRFGNARTILVEHDITFDLQDQLLAASTESGSARWELEQQAMKWERFEKAAWPTVDCVAVMSAKDSETVAGARSTEILPNGVDCDRFEPSNTPPEQHRLLFIGSFAHLPNLLALEFFLKQVWPRLGPGYTLHIIAGRTPEYFLEYHRHRVQVDLNASGIELEGFVADVRPAYRRAEIVVAPLTASAGTNIKILEAMAMGKAVVSTRAGINGLDLEHGVDVFLADDAEQMATLIRDYQPGIEARARQKALEFDWRSIGEQQAALYDRLDWT